MCIFRGDGSESVRLSEIYSKLEEIEADKAPARASVVLAGLGFKHTMQQQMTKLTNVHITMVGLLEQNIFAPVPVAEGY
ncbi:hypothetical protein AB205_0143970 [Aquarana catesbeiana]|uniref:Uncharacterized protein n=1 Tax=Aquarana catesbeiana TaxID=8400 RepID=A0A2G9R9M9_AQUCT|nr:hypothetical protein AB205_0143970 [Aquarana catesbeiana]